MHRKHTFYQGDAVVVCMAHGNSFPWQEQQKFVATIVSDSVEGSGLCMVETEDGDLLSINLQSRDFLGFAAVREP
jgi:hypothetical protein